ncbi:unnamed protein product, partial [Brenthis ino]
MEKTKAPRWYLAYKHYYDIITIRHTPESNWQPSAEVQQFLAMHTSILLIQIQPPRCYHSSSRSLLLGQRAARSPRARARWSGDFTSPMRLG